MNEASGAKVVLACDRSQAARFEGVNTNSKDDWNMSSIANRLARIRMKDWTS